MSNSIVREAIELRLAAWAATQTPAIPIAVENVGYTPVPGQRYLRGLLLPDETKNPSQGGLHKQYHGMYQVIACSPEGQGVADIETVTKDIEVLFKAPTTIEWHGRNVNITRTPAVAKGMSDGAGFYMVPVTIWYEMHDFS